MRSSLDADSSFQSDFACQTSNTNYAHKSDR